ncbi:MAG: hypothetical protein AB1758_12165 [Candidatus Eremiobacterota bacterium]
MDPFLMGLFFGASYLTGLVGVQQVGLSLHDRGKPERAVTWFRLATRLALSPKLRLVFRGNLMAALHCSGDYAAVDREWLLVRDRLHSAGGWAPLLQACYAASLFYRGKYGQGVEVTTFRPVAGQRQAGVDECEMLLFVNRGACLFELGRFEEAWQCLEEAARRTSRQRVVTTALSLARARHHLHSGQTEEVLRLLRSSDFDELPPVYASDVELHRAAMFARCGAVREAAELLHKPRQYESPRARYLRPMAEAYLLQASHEPRRALVEFQRALDSRYPAGESCLHAGELAARIGDLAAARDFYLACIGTDPECIWALEATQHLQQLPT